MSNEQEAKCHPCRRPRPGRDGREPGAARPGERDERYRHVQIDLRDLATVTARVTQRCRPAPDGLPGRRPRERRGDAQDRCGHSRRSIRPTSRRCTV